MKYSKWLELMQYFGFDDNEAEFKKIRKFYNQSHRHYHNANHIEDCLQKSEILEETKSNYELKLAIWYHDLIYSTFKKNNELKSAEMAKSFLIKQSASEELISRICNLIMATLHNANPRNLEEAYIMDIDISILGSDPITYKNYTEQIRREYKLIPWFLYRKKRIEIMEMFLKRKELYFTDYFKSKYEINARQNIMNEIEKLKS